MSPTLERDTRFDELTPEDLGLPDDVNALYRMEFDEYARISRDPGFRRYWREQGAQNEELASKYKARDLRRQLGEKRKPFERTKR